MTKLMKRNMVIWGSIGVVAVIVLCLCLTLGRHYITENRESTQGKQNETSAGTENDDADVPEIELPDDNFEQEENKDSQSSSEGNAGNNDFIDNNSDSIKDDTNKNESDNTNSNDSSAIVLPEIPIP